jgi:hypothetical protein
VESPPRETAPVKREPIKREPQREPTDREITAALLKERGWSADDIAKILGGPPSQAPAQRVQEAEAARVKESDADHRGQYRRCERSVTGKARAGGTGASESSNSGLERIS